MSRICGFADIHRREKHVSTLIDDLVEPFLHSPLYKSEIVSDDHFAMARTYYESGHASTYLTREGYKGSRCLFNGYLLNLRAVAEKIRREVGDQVAIDNPAELIAYLILEKGPQSLKELNGIFSFALLQPAETNLWLGVDRYGMRPLYYIRRDDLVKFASEVKALLPTESDPGLDLCSLEEMFVFGFLLGDNTMFNNISRVPPATVMHFNSVGIKSHRYWWFDEVQIDSGQTVADYLAENDRLLREVIQNTSSHLTDVTCLVSSGYDSRRIILDLADCGKNIHSFTVAYSKTRDKYEVESEISKKIGAELGTNHTVAEHAAPGEEPSNIVNMLTLLDFESDEHQFIMPLLRHIPENGNANFDGLGGDILINGLFLRKEILEVSHDNRKLTRKILQFNPNLWEAYVKTDSNRPSLEERILAVLKDLPDTSNKLTTFFFLTRTRREIGLFPYGLLNLKIESFLPYLDNALFNQSLSLPAELKCGTNLQDQILRLRHSAFMDKVPNSHIRDISINPDASDLGYCRPLGDYWRRVLRDVYSASSREILRSGAFFWNLKARAKLISVGFPIMNLFGRAPGFAIQRAWRLCNTDAWARHRG
jgi:asparagine synthetase B (glutamine-hydrolysing)